MSDPRFHRTVALAPPFEDRHVTIDTEPPMRVWIDVRKALLELPIQPGDSLEDAVDHVLDLVAPMIVSHDLVAVDTGEPLELRFASMSPGQLKGVIAALSQVVLPEQATQGQGPGEPADPLPANRRARRAHASRARTSRSR